LLLKILQKYSEYSDEQLVKRFQKSGDTYYAAQLFERYNELTVSMSLSYLKNRMDAEDAAMECFEVLVRDLATTEVQNFGGWYYSVVRNLLLKYKRQSKKVQSTTLEEDFHTNAAEIDVEELFDEMPILEIEAVLDEAFSALKAEQATALKLFFLEGKSYDTVAAAMEVDIKKVKSLIQNGKRKMKIVLEQRNIKSSDEIL
jgi:RNA polymerase sigma factor (sigma-70 family)